MHALTFATTMLLVGVACGDGTGPSGTVAINFCAGTPLTAIQAQGDVMRAVPTSGNAGRFRGSEPVVVVRQTPGDTIEVLYVTAEQAAVALRCPDATKRLTGSIEPASAAGGIVWISAGTALGGATSAFPDYELRRVTGAGAFDLVAARRNDPKIIIRRGQQFPDNATLPLLDFASEGFPGELHTVTLTGGPAGSDATTRLITNGGTIALLYMAGQSTTETRPIVMLPAAQMVKGDLHAIEVNDGSGQYAEIYVAAARDVTVAMGPEPGTVTMVNDRVEIVAQPEYDAYVDVKLCELPQTAGSFSHNARIVMTREYVGGTPGIWSLPKPDLRAVFPTAGDFLDLRSWGRCGVIVTSRPFGMSNGAARDGDVYRTAYQ